MNKNTIFIFLSTNLFQQAIFLKTLFFTKKFFFLKEEHQTPDAGFLKKFTKNRKKNLVKKRKNTKKKIPFPNKKQKFQKSKFNIFSIRPAGF